jgi:hypothetical protein
MKDLLSGVIPEREKCKPSYRAENLYFDNLIPAINEATGRK